MPDLGILFFYYKQNDPVSDQNLESWRRHNPDLPVIPVFCSHPDQPWPEKHPTLYSWRNCDLNLYYWYDQPRSVDCARWLYVEWDAYCNLPAREFLRMVWDKDVAAASVKFLSRDPEWEWFEEVKMLPPAAQPLACGVSPFACTMLSDRALAAVANTFFSERWQVFCELRLATMAHLNGYAPVANPLAGPMVTWRQLHPEDVNGPGIYHSVKFMLR